MTSPVLGPLPAAGGATEPRQGELQDNYLDEIVDCQEAVAVAGVERKAGGEGGRRDEQVGASGITALCPVATTAEKTRP